MANNSFLHFVIEPSLLKRLDDYRFKNRFPSRAAAIKFLLEWALSQKPTPKPEAESGLLECKEIWI